MIVTQTFTGQMNLLSGESRQCAFILFNREIRRTALGVVLLDWNDHYKWNVCSSATFNLTHFITFIFNIAPQSTSARCPPKMTQHCLDTMWFPFEHFWSKIPGGGVKGAELKGKNDANSLTFGHSGFVRLYHKLKWPDEGWRWCVRGTSLFKTWMECVCVWFSRLSVCVCVLGQHR